MAQEFVICLVLLLDLVSRVCETLRCRGRVSAAATGEGCTITDISFSPDGTKIALACSDGSVQVMDRATRQCRHACHGHRDWVCAVAWSPDGSRIASGGSDQAVRVWDAATGALVRTYRGHHDEVRTLAWSPDGAAIASAGGDRVIRIWQVATGRILCTCAGHTNAVTSLAWSPLAMGGPHSSPARETTRRACGT